MAGLFPYLHEIKDREKIKNKEGKMRGKIYASANADGSGSPGFGRKLSEFSGVCGAFLPGHGGGEG
jgi:hypothetical protein